MRRWRTPWYVGKTNRLGFNGEVFTPTKLVHYNHVLADHYEKGTPVLYLVPRLTSGGKICVPSNGHRDVDFLEKLLIRDALRANPDLRNKLDTKLLRELHVPGIVNPTRGAPPAASVALRKMLGL